MLNKKQFFGALLAYSVLQCKQEPSPHHKLALHFLEKNNKESGVYHLLKAYDHDPNNEDLLLHLASVYFFGREYEKSIPYFEQYLEKKPGDSDIMYYIGSAYNRQGNFTKSNGYFKRAFEKSGDTLCRAELLKNYVRSKQWKQAEEILQPTLWWYDTNISGKKILLDLYKDGNGIGDMIFFLRYAKHIKQAGATVCVNIPDALHALFKSCPYVDHIDSPATVEPEEYDHVYSICICSYILKARNLLYTNMCDTPYLAPDKELVEKWNHEFKTTNLKIGLYWEGTPNNAFFLGKQLENPRTVSFDALKTLQTIPGISWYSLQKDAAVIPDDFPLHTFDLDSDHEQAFMDTAAIMQHLDLVISIDGSIAHLAGAMNIPVWLILPCENDYRWFQNRTTSPWYPTMRLFRQQKYGQWDPVIEEIKKEIDTMLLLES